MKMPLSSRRVSPRLRAGTVKTLWTYSLGLLLVSGSLVTPVRVQAEISSPSCQFTGAQLNLGTYSSTASVDSAQTIGFSCAVGFSWGDPDPRATFRLCLSMGEDPGNQVGYQPWRYLKNNNVTGTGEAHLAYNLYADPSHSQILMPENTGTPLVVDFTLSGGNGSTYVSSNGSIPIYARIASGQGALPANIYHSYNPPFTLRYQAVSGGVPPASCDGGSASYANGNIQIITQVTDSCSLSTRSVNFGTLTEVGQLKTAKLAEGEVTVQCSSGKPYTLYLGGGNHPATNGYRQMANGEARLPYQLYQDPARIRVWDETGGTMQTGGVGGVSGVSDGSSQALTVYGLIATGTTVPGNVGTYTDTVMVTVAY
ncbi:spore coat protein U domain-containing protein [Serratia proteamaculans]|uniref:Csu type fimbrial protein n=1 Tax=Serratia proteamaculans TaxID=28151 RepID=UPI001C55D48F|nr:spore coat U domain-containing protein [Serratia proteamaculans]WEO87218.1 spore coat U domain-containing protein [Serratia proteamaculans]